MTRTELKSSLKASVDMMDAEDEARTRYDADAGLWVVEVWSPLERWIVQGEWPTQEKAEADRRNWVAA